MTISFVTFVAWCRLHVSNICLMISKRYIYPWIISPTYSLGGVSCLSALFPGARLLALSSSVLLVSTISVSSVEITCCCLRGFFLGEAPGRRSPGWEDKARVEAWEERDGAGAVEGAMGTAKKRTHKYIVISLFSHIPPYIYAFSRRFYPKRLTIPDFIPEATSGYTFLVSMCVPWELNPQPFCAANAMLYHWATGTYAFILSVST